MQSFPRNITFLRACLFQSGLLQWPTTTGTCLTSFRWLSNIHDGASSKAADTTKADRIEAFYNAYRQRLGVEPPNRMSSNFFAQSAKRASTLSLIQNLDDLIDTFGKETTACILRTQPRLLTCSVETLRARLPDILSLYGWTKEEGNRVLRKDARIIAHSMDFHVKWRKEMAKTLAASDEVISRMVRRSPNLLGLSKDNMSAKIASLETAFRGVAPSATQLVLKCLSLLSHKSETFAAKISTLSIELGPYISCDVRQVLVAHPALITVSSLMLMRKSRTLSSACQIDQEWMGALQDMKPATLAACLIYGEKVFGRLVFYQQSSPRTRKYAFSTLLMMQSDKFDALYPDFEQWWQKRGKEASTHEI